MKFPIYLGAYALEQTKKASLQEIQDILSTGIITLDRGNDEAIKWIQKIKTNPDYSIKDTEEEYIVTLPVIPSNQDSKNLLPAVIFNASSEDNSRTKPFTKLTKFFIQDIDIKHIDIDAIEDYVSHQTLTNDIFDDIKRNATPESGIVSLWVSPSNKGLKVLYTYSITEGKERELDHLQTLGKTVNINLENFLGLNLQDYAQVVTGSDGKTKILSVLDETSDRAKQLCYLSKSPKYWFNKNSAYLQKQGSMWKPVKDTAKYILKKEKEYLTGYDPNSSYQSGFDDAMIKFLGSMNEAVVPANLSLNYLEKWFNYKDRSGVPYKDKLIKKHGKYTTGKSFRGRKTITRTEADGTESFSTNGSWFSYSEKNGVTINRTQLEVNLYEFGVSYLDDEPSLYWIDGGIIKEIGDCKRAFHLFTNWYNKHFIKYYNDKTDLFKTYDKWVIEQIKDTTLDYIKVNLEKINFDIIHSDKITGDTRRECFLNLSNGKLRITKDSVELIKYSRENLVFEEQVRKVAWTPNLLSPSNTPYTWNDYKSLSFYDKICEGNPDKMKALKSLLGMNIHRYKTGTNNLINILMDGFEEDIKKSGGSGKTLLLQNIEHIRNVTTLHTAKLGNFTWQKVEKWTEVIILQDLKWKDFQQDELRCFLDLSLTPEKKFKTPFELKGEKCPRCVVTTNYASDSEEDADIRRVNIFCIPDYFSKSNPVSNLLGRFMFNDYDTDDWHCWLLFMIECVQVYLNEGLVKFEEPKKIAFKKLARFKNNIEFQDLIDHIEEEVNLIKAGTKSKWEFKRNDLVAKYKSRVGSEKLDLIISMICDTNNMIYEKNKTVRKGELVTKVNRIISKTIKDSLF